MWLQLYLRLRSDATFGRGDGVAGLVDAEVEHDGDGMPYLRGRTLKGLLVEECANLLFALAGHPSAKSFEASAGWLFGQAGSTLEDDALIRVGNATLPPRLRVAVHADIAQGRLKPEDVLESLTAIRHQTAVDEASGAPEKGSLRLMRVVLRETTLVARLGFAMEPDATTLALLAACARSLRRAGAGRNRGRGRLAAWLKDEHGQNVSDGYLCQFEMIVGHPVVTTSAP